MAADPMTGDMITVLVVDDHPVFRRGLLATLAELPGVRVVGTAGDGAEAVRLAAELRPDVVLMDLGLPVLDGRSATARIRAADASVAVLVLTMADDPDAVAAAVAAGARGYLLKGADETAIAHALSTVAGGGVVFGPEIGERVLHRLTGQASSERFRPPFPELTNRDRDVLDLVAAGLGNLAIARRLSLSDKTVRNQVSSILSKLGAADRAEAIARARAAGLGGPSHAP